LAGVELSKIRQDVVDSAYLWASPGVYKPTPEEMIQFFADANCEQKPSLAEATRSVNRLGSGCYVGGFVKQWCGIFGVSVLANCGVGIRWSLMSGGAKHTDGSFGFRIHYDNRGVQPGDIALIHKFQHHFIITDIDQSTGALTTVDGNQMGNTIQDVTSRNIKDVYAYYGIVD
jgi:hypothetical protein